MNPKNHDVFIHNENNFNIPSEFNNLIASILSLENVFSGKIVTISFINDQEMKKLHEKFIGYAHSTDVLSFEAGEFDPESGKEILGDIVICYPFVVQQSQSLENDLLAEIKLMVIHGMLHLLGYDHSTKEQKTIMWQRQSEILKSNEISLNQLPE
jgi:probable rRNA maturation factor